MGEIVKIKKFSKKSESSKFWGKNQKIFVHPRTELRTPREKQDAVRSCFDILKNRYSRLYIRRSSTRRVMGIELE